jgi:ADP-heptose:LPS heptosyltransferase
VRPGPNDPWLKRAELWVRRRVVRTFGALVHRRSNPPTPADLASARILLIRQDRIGDVLVSTPLIAALRDALPALQIDLLLSTNNVAALPGLSGIRKAWVYERTFLSMVRLVRQLRREQYDVAMDLMDNPSATSTAFCVLSGARWTVGLEKENDYSYDVRVPLRSRRDYHIIERLSPLAEPFGINAAEAERSVVYTPQQSSRDLAHALMRERGILQHRKIGVNISAGSERRFWGTDRYRDIVAFLSERHPEAAILILCKPGDRDRADEIVRDQSRAWVVPPSTSFDAFAACVAHLDALITPDTSVVHLASAFKVPAVVLYIQSNPDLHIWEPYATPHAPVVTTVDDLASISTEAVRRAWIDLLDSRPLKWTLEVRS